MCGRITVLTREELAELVREVEARRSGEDMRATSSGECFAAGQRDGQRGQARPGSSLACLVQRGPGIEIADLTWGIQPPWAKKPIFNARIESVLSGSGMWAAMVESGRCILPAATFFEANTLGDRAAARAYEFHMADGSPLLLAGLQEQGRLSVVTTEPNAAVAPVHPRMPLALTFQEVPAWLEGGRADLARLADRSRLQLEGQPELPRSSRKSPAGSPAEPAQLALF